MSRSAAMNKYDSRWAFERLDEMQGVVEEESRPNINFQSTFYALRQSRSAPKLGLSVLSTDRNIFCTSSEIRRHSLPQRP